MTFDRKKKPLSPPAFDWAGPERGHWAMLRDGDRTVTLTSWPQTLLSMLKAGVLAGEAKRDAEALVIELKLPYLVLNKAQRERLAGEFGGYVIESEKIPLTDSEAIL